MMNVQILQNENADSKGCGESQIDSDSDGTPDVIDNCSDTLILIKRIMITMVLVMCVILTQK